MVINEIAIQKTHNKAVKNIRLPLIWTTKSRVPHVFVSPLTLIVMPLGTHENIYK